MIKREEMEPILHDLKNVAFAYKLLCESEERLVQELQALGRIKDDLQAKLDELYDDLAKISENGHEIKP